MVGWVRSLWDMLLGARRPPRVHGADASVSLATIREDYARRWRSTLEEWLVHHQREIVLKQCRWMGVVAFKNPLDSWIYQEILFEVRPDVLVEIGSHAGGSTLFFSHMFDLLQHGRVVSIDLSRQAYVVKHDRITEITGDCSTPEVVAQVAELCSGRSVMVVHDGDHRFEAVLRDLRLYAPFVSKGSYLVVEDGIVDLFPGDADFGGFESGPLAATAVFLAENPRFVSDPVRERYLLTYNPGGFLRHV